MERVFLRVPFLIPQAASTAARAESLAVSVLLAGGPGRGAYRVARALHRGGDPVGFISVRLPLADADDIDRRIRSALSADPHLESLALYVERLDVQPPPVQEALARWLDEGVRSGGRTLAVRLFGQTDRSAAVSLPGLLPVLRRHLSVLVIPLPPLSERRDDVPALAEILAADVARRLERPPPALDEDLRRRLVEWPASLEDLETALVRAILTGDGRTIRSADLEPFMGTTAFSPPVPSPASGPAPSGPSPQPVRSARESVRLESVITELAHELKNPMVTIKTFAQHMDHLLSDVELREKFTRLTNEAIERMDGFLDELLQFSRFSVPNPRPIDLSGLLSRSLSMTDPSARERVHSNGLPADFLVVVDEEQLVFAVRALIRGLARELPADAAIMLSCRASNEVVLRADAPGLKGKLQGLLYHENGSGSETSLHFVLAEALVQRNGGTCRIVRESDSIEAHLMLPVAPG
ncbi:MAG: histidine kinase dimerization/phospho-acceptor domain-containing protein [Candidatus Binatia bacterium]